MHFGSMEGIDVPTKPITKSIDGGDYNEGDLFVPGFNGECWYQR